MRKYALSPRAACLAVAASVVGLWAGASPAQMTGTLITHQPAQVSTKDKDAARKMSRGFASCVVDRSSGRVKAYLALPYGTEASTKLASHLYDRESDDCMGIAELSLSSDLFRGQLYEALYLREFGDDAAPNLEGAPAVDYAAPYDGAEIPPAGQQSIALLRFADCVIRKNVTASRTLLSLAPGSSTESRTFSELLPSFSGCLPKDQQFAFSKSVLRGAIAEVLYRTIAAQNVADAK